MLGRIRIGSFKLGNVVGTLLAGVLVGQLAIEIDPHFATLLRGTVETLLKPENKAKLAGILTYHVVAGNVKAADVVKLTSAKTVQGQSVAIDAKDGVKINNAKVVKADIETSNGVIHVIDTVLLPKE